MQNSSWRDVTGGLVRETLVLRERRITLWHSLFFVTNIGAALLLGLVTGHVRASIVGAIAGLVFSLSDSDEALNCRLRLLWRAALMMLVFGFIGAQLDGYKMPFWIIFALLTLATARLSLTGNVRAGAFRFGALALVTTASMPGLSWDVAGMVVFSALLSTATRILSHKITPEAEPVLPLAMRRELPSGAVAVRYCLCFAGATMAGLILGEMLGVLRPVWIATTVLIVMQPDARTSYFRIAQRILGTGVGVLLAMAAINQFHSIVLLLFVVLALASLVPHGSSRNYWIHSALVSCLILVLYDFAAIGQGFDARLLVERMRDVCLGAALSFVATALAGLPKADADD